MRDLDAAGGGPVWRRAVFFVSGFDPHGPRRYHRLYRAEGARQARWAGYRLEVGGLRHGDGVACWDVALDEAAGRSVAEFVFLRWDDIARARMRMSLVRAYLLMARTVWAYFGSGAFWRLFRLRRSSTLVGVYAVALLCLYLCLAMAAGYGVGRALAWGGAPPWAAWAAGALTIPPALVAARRWDQRVMGFYLMFDFGFTAAHAAGRAPEMEARLDEFAARVAAADADEVLVVGHSSGAAYAVSVAARAAALGAGPISLLTLGQTIPMLSFLPGASRMRAELAAVEAHWIDVTSAADGGCYALADPAAVSGAGRGPKVISARFSDRVSKALGREMRRSRFRTHIQYLCAFDLPGDYDFFRITAGGLRLAERFRDRPESPRTKRAALVFHG